MTEGMGRKGLFVMITAVVACLFLCREQPVYAQEVTGAPTLELPLYIYADYIGGSGLVGSEIDREKIRVNAAYADGSNVPVTDYLLSVETIQNAGNNEISVAFQGKHASFYVVGRTVSNLTAYYTGSDVSVGNAVNRQNIYAYVTYEDGGYEISREFEIDDPLIRLEGDNIIGISYGGKSTTVKVKGYICGEVSVLQATYAGEQVMLGSKIDRDKIYVTALYADGSSESIVNYQLSMESPTMIGANDVIVTYRGKTANFMVTGYERSISRLSARYVGEGVEVGKEVRRQDIRVTATYSDGTVERVEEYSLPTPVIYFEGAHMKTVHYMGMTADIYVIGVPMMPTSYRNALAFDITNGIHEASCKLALPSGLEQSAFHAESLRKASVSQVVPRAVRRSDFIAFEITAEPDGEDELPLEMKLTPPEGYDAKHCVLYYTPNRKTIIGRMNSYVNEDGDLVVTVYKMGTFLLAFEPEEEEEE